MSAQARTCSAATGPPAVSVFPCGSINCTFVWLATSAGRFFSQSVAPLVKGLPKS